MKLPTTSGGKILLTEPPMNPLKNRERMCEVMFEKYDFGGATSLFRRSSLFMRRVFPLVWLLTRVMVLLHIVPVYESVVLNHLTRRLDVAVETSLGT